MPKTNISIAITGANGFIGKALCSAVLAQGHSFTAITRSPMSAVHGARNRAVGSMDAHTDWASALMGCDTVVHLAAHQASGINMTTELEVCRRVNVQGTENLARQAVRMGVRRFVFVSSVKVCGETSLAGKPFSESDTPAPSDAYAISKWEAEQRLLEIAAETRMNIVIVRPPLVYGFGVRGNIQDLVRIVKLGIPLPLGLVRNKRSMVSITNLVDFLLLCCVHPAAAQETFLVSDVEDISVPQLLARMGAIMETSARLLPVPIWTLKIAASASRRKNVFDKLCGNLQVDTTKARVQLGWTPPQSLDEGLRQMLGSLQQ